MPIKPIQLGDAALARSAELFRTKIERVKRFDRSPVAAAQMLDTPERTASFVARETERARLRGAEPPLVDDGDVGVEGITGPINDLQSIEFLEQGSQVARAVCRVEVMGESKGTGFLVAPDIVLTNHHVLPTPEAARAAQLIFFDEDQRIRPTREIIYAQLRPDLFYASSSHLDFAFVQVKIAQSGAELPSLDECGWLPLLKEQGKILIAHPVNIIQHPGGQRKQLVVQNSVLLELLDGVMSEELCWYSGDTQRGSSGAPVLNNAWEVAALHRRGVPRVDRSGYVLDKNGNQISDSRYRSHPEAVHWIANEGVRVSRVVQGLQELVLPSKPMAEIRTRILELWKSDLARFGGGFKAGWGGVGA